MKKITKATIAAAAAGVLLLGGAGTVALWSGADDIDAGTVTTGHLTLNATTPGVWTDTSVGAATTEFNPATEHLVPGDTLSYTQIVDISADGKNLKGEFTVGDLDSAIPAALTNDVTVMVAAAPTDPQLVVTEGVVSFTEPGEYEVPVTITVAFAEGTTGSTEDTTMGQGIDLTALALTLNQVRP